MKKYDHIELVEKNIDEITVVEKFNPFHDAQGKFSSANGFKSYSANPNTKAGAMAIARSAAAGHGNTPNVHRQSYGENIRQNANWLGHGNQLNPRHQGNATLRQRTEPYSGLAGASATGALWQAQNGMRGRTTKPGKQPPQQAQQQPKQPPKQQPKQTQQQAKPQANAAQQQTKPQGGNLAQDMSGVNLTSGNKLAIQHRNGQQQTTTSRKVTNDNYQSKVDGKDISKTFDADSIRGNARAIDKVAKAQGWDKPATVTSDLEVFQKAAVKSGRVMYRSVDGNGRETADQICKKTMADGKTALGGNGGKVYGGGLYMTDCQIKANGTASSNGKRLASSSRESYCYGQTQMMATVHPNAKIATPTQANKMKQDYYNLSGADQRRFGNDFGAYIASKGYDGAKWHLDSDPCAYTTVYNKSAMIFYSEVADRY